MGHPTCTWVVCDDCRTTIDPLEFRAVRNGASVAWPHSKPQ